MEHRIIEDLRKSGIECSKTCICPSSIKVSVTERWKKCTKNVTVAWNEKKKILKWRDGTTTPLLYSCSWIVISSGICHALYLWCYPAFISLNISWGWTAGLCLSRALHKSLCFLFDEDQYGCLMHVLILSS